MQTRRHGVLEAEPLRREAWRPQAAPLLAAVQDRSARPPSSSPSPLVPQPPFRGGGGNRDIFRPPTARHGRVSCNILPPTSRVRRPTEAAPTLTAKRAPNAPFASLALSEPPRDNRHGSPFASRNRTRRRASRVPSAGTGCGAAAEGSRTQLKAAAAAAEGRRRLRRWRRREMRAAAEPGPVHSVPSTVA